jgi:hypothetical protein
MPRVVVGWSVLPGGFSGGVDGAASAGGGAPGSDVLARGSRRVGG